jgi:hypothetical protein
MFIASLIPDDWSPEEALAVYQFLQTLSERIWERYHDEVVAFLQADRMTYRPEDPQRDLPFNDDIPF